MKDQSDCCCFGREGREKETQNVSYKGEAAREAAGEAMVREVH